MYLEILFAYGLLLRVGLFTMQQYNDWLDDVFQKTNMDNEMLLELEICSNAINKTITMINDFTNPQLKKLDLSAVGKTLFKALENKYYQDEHDLENLAHKAYSLWNILPSEMSNIEPFFTLCYIDDPISYGDEKQTRALFEKLFTYYG